MFKYSEFVHKASTWHKPLSLSLSISYPLSNTHTGHVPLGKAFQRHSVTFKQYILIPCLQSCFSTNLRKKFTKTGLCTKSVRYYWASLWCGMWYVKLPTQRFTYSSRDSYTKYREKTLSIPSRFWTDIPSLSCRYLVHDQDQVWRFERSKVSCTFCTPSLWLLSFKLRHVIFSALQFYFFSFFSYFFYYNSRSFSLNGKEEVSLIRWRVLPVCLFLTLASPLLLGFAGLAFHGVPLKRTFGAFSWQKLVPKEPPRPTNDYVVSRAQIGPVAECHAYIFVPYFSSNRVPWTFNFRR